MEETLLEEFKNCLEEDKKKETEIKLETVYFLVEKVFS